MFQLTRVTRALVAFTLVVLMTNSSAEALDQTEQPRGDNLATLTQAGPTPIEVCHQQKRAISRHACAARVKQFNDANEMRIESQRR